jgi:hypothetical protein
MGCIIPYFGSAIQLLGLHFWIYMTRFICSYLLFRDLPNTRPLRPAATSTSDKPEAEACGYLLSFRCSGKYRKDFVGPTASNIHEFYLEILAPMYLCDGPTSMSRLPLIACLRSHSPPSLTLSSMTSKTVSPHRHQTRLVQGIGFKNFLWYHCLYCFLLRYWTCLIQHQDNLPDADRIAVRLNDINTTFFQQDIDQIVGGLDFSRFNIIFYLSLQLQCPGIRTLVLPKIHSAQDLHHVSKVLHTASSTSPRDRPMHIVASIESARSLWNLGNIAGWKSEYDPEISGTISALLVRGFI